MPFLSKSSGGMPLAAYRFVVHIDLNSAPMAQISPVFSPLTSPP